MPQIRLNKSKPRKVLITPKPPSTTDKCYFLRYQTIAKIITPPAATFRGQKRQTKKSKCITKLNTLY